MQESNFKVGEWINLGKVTDQEDFFSKNENDFEAENFFVIKDEDISFEASVDRFYIDFFHLLGIEHYKRIRKIYPFDVKNDSDLINYNYPFGRVLPSDNHSLTDLSKQFSPKHYKNLEGHLDQQNFLKKHLNNNPKIFNEGFLEKKWSSLEVSLYTLETDLKSNNFEYFTLLKFPNGIYTSDLRCLDLFDSGVEEDLRGIILFDAWAPLEFKDHLYAEDLSDTDLKLLINSYANFSEIVLPASQNLESSYLKIVRLDETYDL